MIIESVIEQARRLAAESGMDIDFRTVSAEQLDFPSGSFDVLHYAATAILKKR